METKAGVLCVSLLVSIVVLGKMFGGSLKGLIPLGCCIASGVWLWAKEVVRSGRELEWDSEKTRGETVRLPLSQSRRPRFADIVPGNSKSFARISGMDEYYAQGGLGPDQSRNVQRSGRYA